MKKPDRITLNNRELGTVLAALQLWNQRPDLAETDPLLWIATNAGLFDELNSDEIKGLIDRLNQPD